MIKLVRKCVKMTVIMEKRNAVPRFSRYLNTAMAAVLYGIGVYHYTQPNAAWRSGTIETVTASLLLVAAFLASSLIAMVINFSLAAILIALGVRHAAIGGGWVSGTTELLFAAILITNAFIINKSRKKNENH